MPNLNVPPDSSAPVYVSPLDSDPYQEFVTPAPVAPASGQTSKEKAFYTWQKNKRYLLMIGIVFFACAPFVWLGSNMLPKNKPVEVPMNPVSVPAPVVTTVAASSVQGVPAPVGFLNCYALADIDLGGRMAPAQSKIMVNGFTFARGGLVSIGGVWVEQGLVRCDGDLRSVEANYFPTATPAPKPSVTPRITPDVTATPVYIRIRETAIPLPTLVPVTSEVKAVNGIYFEDSGCIRIGIYNVREVWVNETPAAGGTVYCGVKSFRVVVQ